MMRVIAKRWCLSLLIGLLSSVMLAQEKTQSYYNTHESEILPDATIAFQNGRYERTVELCKWHYIIVGDNAADSLREKAERCAQLCKEMEEDFDAGKKKDAGDKARMLLSLNSNDTSAKQLLEELEKQEEPAPIDTGAVPSQIVQDTIVVEKPVPKENISEKVDQDTVFGGDQPIEESKSRSPITPDVPLKSDSPHTRLVLKANVCVLDTKRISESFAPGGSLGIYDLGGTPLGFETGAYFCPGLSAESVSMFGVDASMVFRVARMVYPKAGVGFFSYKSTDGVESGSKGLCAGLGCTFLLSGHICLEIGVKYYPVLKLGGFETVSTAGSSYEFPTTREVLPGGIAPFVSLGWAF